MLAALEAKVIKHPTPNQVQGVPEASSGRDGIEIAFTGSAKDGHPGHPLVMLELEEEMTPPVVVGE